LGPIQEQISYNALSEQTSYTRDAWTFPDEESKTEEPLPLAVKHGETHTLKEKASEKVIQKCNPYKVFWFWVCSGFFITEN